MATLPIIAGILSPGLLTVGLFIWQDRWKKDALSLNTFKCCFATFFFAVLVASFSTQSSQSQYKMDVVGYMMLSSALGIIIADTWWLIALQRIGARRMITIDAVKPFLALAFGSFVLQDRVGMWAIIGIVLTSLGILLVNLEKREDVGSDVSGTDSSYVGHNTLLADDGMVHALPKQTPNIELTSQSQSIEQTPQSLEADIHPQTIDDSMNIDSTSMINDNEDGFDVVAYLYALGNVILDVYAATLIVKWHGTMSSADVNLIRFGFAGVTLASVIGVRSQKFPSLNRIFNQDESAYSSQMSRSDWLAVSAGIVFVTVLTPLVNTWVLFKLPLAIAITLNSTSPLWSLPVAYFHHEIISSKAIVGALLATGGIVLLVLG